MCNLYSLNKKRDDVARFFRVSHNRAAAYEPLSAIFPCHTAPIIKQSADGEREARAAQLGVHPASRRLCPQAGDQYTRRQGGEQILEGQLRASALPGGGDRLLRARRRQAGSLALVRPQR